VIVIMVMACLSKSLSCTKRIQNRPDFRPWDGCGKNYIQHVEHTGLTTLDGIGWIPPLLVLIHVNVCIAAVSLVVQMDAFTRYQMDTFSRSFVI
jgi:hypothetical protein